MIPQFAVRILRENHICDLLKINLFFRLSYYLRLLLIVCGDIESNPGTGSDKRVRVL